MSGQRLVPGAEAAWLDLEREERADAWRGRLRRRYDAKVVKGEGCWGWVGARHRYGYGQIYFRGRVDCAHRVSWLLHCGPIPAGVEVCHRCDNPVCSRPDHLFLGTHADNQADMARKGRSRPSGLAGEAHPNAKLTEDAVRAIRAEHAAGIAKSALARRFGVTRRTIRDVVRRRWWTHVT